MKSLSQTLPLLICAASIMSASAAAEESHHQFGVTSYALSLDAGSISDGTNTVDITTEASGGGLFYAATFNANVAMKATLYWLNVDEISDISVSDGDVNGIEGQLLVGSNLNQPGFKAYIAPGIYSEDVSFGNASTSFEGFQLGGGLGYNWSVVSVDLWLNWRDSSEYEDFLKQFAPASLEDDVEVAAFSAGLGLSLRF